MPQSPTDIPSVITVENTDRMILSVLFSREIFFLPCFAICKTVGVPSVVGFFISNRISNGMGNYQRSVFRLTDSVGEAVGKNVNDGFCALHGRN